MGAEQVAQKLGEYLQDWEHLDDEERSDVWKHMDKGLKQYVRQTYGEEWEHWTYSPEEWNEMDESDKKETWNKLPEYEQTFLQEHSEYSTRGLEPEEDDGSYDIGDTLYSTGLPSAMMTAVALRTAKTLGTSTAEAMYETGKEYKSNFVDRIAEESRNHD